MEINHLCTIKRQHSCTYLPTLPHRASWWAKTKRRFRTWTLLSTHHPKNIEFFKSATGVRRERKRHARSPHPYIIHPFSKFRIYYEMYMIVVYLLVLVINCASYSMDEVITSTELIYEAFSLLCLADIIITLCTGYVKEQMREIVLEPKKIVWRYVKTMFLFVDLAAFTPLKSVGLLLDPSEQRDYAGCVNIIRIVIILRLFTINTYVLNTAEYFGLNTNKVFIAGRHMINLFVVVHFLTWTCFTIPEIRVMLTGQIYVLSWIRQAKLLAFSDKRYPLGIFGVTGYVLGSSAGIFSPVAFEEIISQIAMYIFGKFFCIFFTVVVLHMMMSSKSLEIKYNKIMDHLEEYMTQKDLPQGMRKRLRMYYDYRYQHKFFREQTVSNILSDGLNREIKIHVCRKLVSNVTLFAGLSTRTVSDILEYLKPEVYLPNDTIIKAGEPGECMYFLSSGTVAVYTPTGKELCHLQDGAYFGEISLIMKDQLRTANVYAVEICEVYSLARRHFKRFFLKNEGLYAKLYQKAEDRLEMLTTLEEYHRYAKWK